MRCAKLLAWLGVAWYGVEAAVAIAAGVLAGSPAPGTLDRTGRAG